MSEPADPPPGLVRRFLAEHVLGYWALQLEIAVCLAGQVLLELLDPLILRALIDQALGDGDVSLLAALVAVLAGTLAFRTAFRLASTWLYSYGGLRILFDFRRRAFERVQQLSPFHLRGERQGDILARLTSDVDVLQRAAVHTVVNAAHDVLVIVGVGALLVYLDPHLALILALVYPLLTLAFVFLNRHLRREGMAARESIGGLYDYLEERIAGTRLVQEFRRERRQARGFVRASRPWMRSNLRLSLFSSFQVSLADAIAALAPILVFLFGGARALRGELSLGTLVAFYTLASRLRQPMMGLVDINLDLQLARAALSRVYAIIDTEPSIREVPAARAPETPRGGFRVQDLGFAWGSESILDDVTFTIEPGQTIAVVGPSGSGKSTLAALLARFLDPTHGSIELDGIDLREWRLADLRRCVRVVPQETQLFHESIRENLLLAAPHATDDELRAALADMALAPFLAALPEGLATVVGKHGARLSGGERQRLALARALLSKPRVLILDEATSALDAHTERVVLDHLRNADRDQRTLVMIAHRLTTVHDADQILVVDGGRLVECGKHAELLALGGAYRGLYDEQ